MIAVCGSSSGETNSDNFTIIKNVWTTNNWNSLIAKINMAGIVGATSS